MEKEILEDFEEQLKNCQLNGLDLEITDMRDSHGKRGGRGGSSTTINWYFIQ